MFLFNGRKNISNDKLSDIDNMLKIDDKQSNLLIHCEKGVLNKSNNNNMANNSIQVNEHDENTCAELFSYLPDNVFDDLPNLDSAIELDEITLDVFDEQMILNKDSSELSSSPKSGNFSDISPMHEYDDPPHEYLCMEDADLNLENIEFEFQANSSNATVPVSRKYTTKRGRKQNFPDNIFKNASLNNEDLDTGRPGQRLQLSGEEKQLLLRLGHRVPTHLPLSLAEDRALRHVRRKIRNKLSAKASRARKQTYLSGLETQISACHTENRQLRRKVKELEQDRRGLLSHVRQLRNFIAKFISSTQQGSDSPDETTPLLPLSAGGRRSSPQQRKNSSSAAVHFGQAAGGTSLLVIAFMVLAWTAVVPLPPFTSHSNNKSPLMADYSSSADMPMPGRSRTLLSKDRPVYGPQMESTRPRRSIDEEPPSSATPEKVSKGTKISSAKESTAELLLVDEDPDEPQVDTAPSTATRGNHTATTLQSPRMDNEDSGAASDDQPPAPLEDTTLPTPHARHIPSPGLIHSSAPIAVA